ncbi:MAG: type II secretion system GspH family protein [Defluviitaleaceae bacterium]|nr:type II secretion system GspH family protein [Defluviitaleaceae bacterium]
MPRKKNTRGFTLLEAVVALAVYSIFAVSASRLLLYASQASANIIARSQAFENARAAADALAANAELAIKIEITTYADGSLDEIILTEPIAAGMPTHQYLFVFTGGSLHLGQRGNTNEFVSGLHAVRVFAQPHGYLTVEAEAAGTSAVVSRVVYVGYKDVEIKIK